MVIQVEFYGEEPVGIELPQTVDLLVTDTVPAIKGATANAQLKPATLETGLVVQVPPFIAPGDRVRVNTETGEYPGHAPGARASEGSEGRRAREPKAQGSPNRVIIYLGSTRPAKVDGAREAIAAIGAVDARFAAAEVRLMDLGTAGPAMPVSEAATSKGRASGRARSSSTRVALASRSTRWASRAGSTR